ncbi:MAG: hypothetical protein WCR27_06340, partial [Eubacteriales bacterium]
MDSVVRFVHCGGFRFNSHSWEGPMSWVSMRNQDLWQTFEAVLTFCETEKVDFLFLTGDIFEQECVSKEIVQRVARSLANLTNTRIFITPGERDPYVTTSGYRFAEWSENVHIFSEGINKIAIPSKNVMIYGAGWTTFRQKKDYLEDFRADENDGLIRIMLLHAEVDSRQNTDGFIPINEDQIASSGLTYLALGHKGNWSGIQQAGATYWADCGAAEARSFIESGAHGVLFGKTDGDLTQVKFVELGQRRYIEKILARQNDDIECLVENILATTTSKERQKDLFRFKLGKSFGEEESKDGALQNILKHKFRYIEVLADEYENTSQIGTNISPTLVQVFDNETQKCLDTSATTEDKTHWELVRKIGFAALSLQGSPNSSEKELKTDLINDEKLLLEEARDSLARAKKKVEEQAENMGKVKDEYDSLRRDWEAANRKQEEQRLLHIEVKNLQAKKIVLVEKIATISKIQERLVVFHQNPDYRELRQIQGELSLLQELLRTTDEELIAYTHNKQVDNNMLEGLRDECLEWAYLLEVAELLASEIQLETEKINEIQYFLQMSGYHKLLDNDEQRLRQAKEDRDRAQKELEKIDSKVSEIEEIEKKFTEEFAKLQEFEVLVKIKAADKYKIKQIVGRLEGMQGAKYNGLIDQVMTEKFGRASINEKLTSRLVHYCQKYHMADYGEFVRKQEEYQNQKQIVENLQTRLERLRREVGREKELNIIVQSRNQVLKQAYIMVNAV